MKELKSILKLTISWLIIGIISGALGAHWISHQLESSLGPIQSNTYLDKFRLSNMYHITQAVGLLAIIAVNGSMKILNGQWSLYVVLLGSILFSISIYVLCLNTIYKVDLIGKFFGPLTPLGGIMMILGWCAILYKILKNK